MINSLKKWIINPCTNCLVFACCDKACTKLRTFIKFQSRLWISIGFIIATTIFTFIIYEITTFNLPVYLVFILAWLTGGVLLYRSIVKVNGDKFANIFATIFSFVWLPDVVFSLYIGIGLGLCFTKKKNAQFLIGDIWK